MNSYTTTLGNVHFNWWNFFEKVESFSLTQEDIDTAISKALRWDTCAVSEQCEEIPRHERTGMPKDMFLANLGGRFANEIKSGHFFSAKKTLSKIELRSMQVVLNYHYELFKDQKLQSVA